jgi:hypothetical protein
MEGIEILMIERYGVKAFSALYTSPHFTTCKTPSR